MRKILILVSGMAREQKLLARQLLTALRAATISVRVDIVDLQRPHLLLDPLTFLPITSAGVLPLGGPGLGRRFCTWLGERVKARMSRRRALQEALRHVLEAAQPDCVISTAAEEPAAMRSLFPDIERSGVRWISCLSGFITSRAARGWAQWSADVFWVDKPGAIRFLTSNGVDLDRIVVASSRLGQGTYVMRSVPTNRSDGAAGVATVRPCFLAEGAAERGGTRAKPQVATVRPCFLAEGGGAGQPFDLPSARVRNDPRESSARALSRLADLALGLIADSTPPLRSAIAGPDLPAPASRRRPSHSALRCDFHIHSTFSDGRLSVRDLVDFYGSRDFDCICVTDHLADPNSMLGRLSTLSGLVMPEHRLEEYFETLAREAKRAWSKYDMILMTGIEFNKDGLTQKTSAHILGVDLSVPPDPGLSIENTLRAIQAQGGLRIASHPHVLRTEWGWNTLYLWENKKRFAPMLDAWEVANRRNLFNPVSLEGLPFVANSDLHQAAHIHSWKTKLDCEKEREAIKSCIRENRDVSIYMHQESGRVHRPELVMNHERPRSSVAADRIERSPFRAVVSSVP